MTRSSKTEGWRVRRRAAGSIGKRVSSRARRSNRTFLFSVFYRWELVVSDRVFRLGFAERPEGGRQPPRTSPTARETRRDERARTSRASCALRLFPDAGAGGSSVRSTIATSASAFASGAAGGLGEAGFLALPPPKKLRMSPGIAPDAGLSRAPPRKRSTSLACPGVARSRERCLRVFENFLFGCQAQGQPCGFIHAKCCRHRSRTTATLWNENLVAIACSLPFPPRRGASARSDASTASSSPWLPSPRPPPWPPPPSCSPARRAIPRFPEL